MEVIEDLRDLLCSGVPLIDTRSPGEFARGSLPSAVNLPLMTDEEREQVGRCYKHEGQQAAIALGHQLVAGALRERRIDAWADFIAAHPNAVLFCFRGGLRSQISQQWLAERGVAIARVEGGYKRMRRWLTDELEAAAERMEMLVVGGPTGSAKTEFINQGCGGQALPGSIDLEGLANHRGSAFGRRLGGQPTQISFEMALAVAVLRVEASGGNRLVLEDEGRLIGRCALPPVFLDRLKASPLVLLESTFEERVEHSFSNYILANLSDLEAHTATSDPFEQFAEGLHTALANISKRLGGERYRELRGLLDAALEQHRSAGDPALHREWIAHLLRDYYDPMYEYQLSQRLALVVQRGRAGELAGRLCPGA